MTKRLTKSQLIEKLGWEGFDYLLDMDLTSIPLELIETVAELQKTAQKFHLELYGTETDEITTQMICTQCGLHPNDCRCGITEVK